MTPAQQVALDAMRSAWDEVTVARMLKAAEGRYVESQETWSDASYMALVDDLRPRLIATTRLRLAESIGRQLLKDGHFIETTTRGAAETTYHLRLLFLTPDPAAPKGTP